MFVGCTPSEHAASVVGMGAATAFSAGIASSRAGAGPPHLLFQHRDKSRREHRQEWPPRGGRFRRRHRAPGAPNVVCRLASGPCAGRTAEIHFASRAPKTPEFATCRAGADRLIRSPWSTDLWKASWGSPCDTDRPEGGGSDPAALSGLVLSEIADASGDPETSRKGWFRARRLNRSADPRGKAGPHETGKRPEFRPAGSARNRLARFVSLARRREERRPGTGAGLKALLAPARSHAPSGQSTPSRAGRGWREALLPTGVRLVSGLVTSTGSCRSPGASGAKPESTTWTELEKKSSSRR
jgi:hypothetical protein